MGMASPYSGAYPKPNIIKPPKPISLAGETARGAVIILCGFALFALAVVNAFNH
jgi:hypothetical protein